MLIDIVESDNIDGSACVSCYTARCKSFMKLLYCTRSLTILSNVTVV